MSSQHHRLLLYCAVHDKTFKLLECDPPLWQGKCIHCQRKVLLKRNGQPYHGSTLEHIWPRSKGGDNTLDNLAIACSRCNSQKGRKVDILSETDERFLKVVETLQQRRLARYRRCTAKLPADLVNIIERVHSSQSGGAVK